jgi:triacylglycerol lipase
MASHEFLSPQEASFIAHNAYFTLKDWISGQPTIGIEKHAVVRNMVTGDGQGAVALSGGANTSLRGTGLGGAKLQSVFAGSTNGTSTGFGYVLSFNREGRRHVVVATRGTRYEHSKADIYTDLRGSMAPMAGVGPVHHGFRNTFDSVKIGLARDEKRLMDADVVHCVGHSLGGAVATLVAAHFAGRGKDVKLYTFGSPRVGALGSSAAMEELLGNRNIFRVAHDLDPVTMLGPYPFSHVNGSPEDENNMTLVSPTGKLLSFANHDMARYVDSVGDVGTTWANVRLASQAVDHDNAVLARWLLRSSDNPGWMTQGTAKGLSCLMKVLSHVLKRMGYAGVRGLTAIDMLSVTLANDLTRMAEANPELMSWLREAAGWASQVIMGIADITARVIRAILMTMTNVLRPIATQAIVNVVGRGIPLPLVLGGATALAGTVLG